MGAFFYFEIFLSILVRLTIISLYNTKVINELTVSYYWKNTCEYVSAFGEGGYKLRKYILGYGLVHIAAGDLLRAEVNSGSKNGKLAKEYMEKGQLVPNDIVVLMVKERLLQPDSQENGWLLDGYPRSYSQAIALKELGFEPDLFILLEVSEEILVERVVGRRLDPVTGKIYHLKYSPPDTEEVAARLTQRFDDTEEKVRLRLQTHHQNVEDVLSMYQDVTVKVNGNASKTDVFDQIDRLLRGLIEQRKAAIESLAA
ncbi:adenylate kinase, chloroplastic isoform X2 [Cucumis sativus]|uniref:adenylate kinase, chloroplastic isoform X2 n=1 Tax=Cucumis sativus TaxID=3659 RepID=UPI0012F4C007|nr:adenylate kinase, chloroplastic isoform X2 [Cucumis sativus]